MPTEQQLLMKRCSKCQEDKPLDAFYKHSGKQSGLQSYCKSCTCTANAQNARKRRNDPEDVLPESDLSICEGDSLYIMSNSLLPDMVKIGRSVNPEERAKQLGASHPFRLAVEFSYGGKGFLEKTLHDRLKHRRVEGGHGREWFRLTAEQADVLVRASVVDHELSKE